MQLPPRKPSVLLVIALISIMGAANARAQNESEAIQQKLPARSLLFPTDRVAGWIFIRPEGLTEEASWRKHHEAWGEVSIPPAHEVRLAIPNLDRGAVSLLRGLRSDDLAELEVTCREFTSAQANMIATLSTLRWLKISCDEMKSEGLEALAQLRSLECLDIHRVHLDETGLDALSTMTQLKEIKLPRDLGDKETYVIGKMSGLTRLDLSNQDRITDEGLRELAPLVKLRDFALPPRTTDEGLKFLREMKSIRSLRLTRTAITDAGFASLKSLDALESLDLSITRIDGRGLSQLAVLKFLREIRMYGTQVNDAALARMDDLPALESLDLSHTPITDSGLAHLADMRHLKRLDLSHTVVSSAGLGNLGKSRTIEQLFLSGTNITDDGLAHLTGMKSLRELVLPIQLSVPAVEQLKKALPHCEIPRDDRFNPNAVAPGPSKSEPIS